MSTLTDDQELDDLSRRLFDSTLSSSSVGPTARDVTTYCLLSSENEYVKVVNEKTIKVERFRSEEFDEDQFSFDRCIVRGESNDNPHELLEDISQEVIENFDDVDGEDVTVVTYGMMKDGEKNMKIYGASDIKTSLFSKVLARVKETYVKSGRFEISVATVVKIGANEFPFTQPDTNPEKSKKNDEENVKSSELVNHSVANYDKFVAELSTFVSSLTRKFMNLDVLVRGEFGFNIVCTIRICEKETNVKKCINMVSCMGTRRNPTMTSIRVLLWMVNSNREKTVKQRAGFNKDVVTRTVRDAVAGNDDLVLFFEVFVEKQNLSDAISLFSLTQDLYQEEEGEEVLGENEEQTGTVGDFLKQVKNSVSGRTPRFKEQPIMDELDVHEVRMSAFDRLKQIDSIIGEISPKKKKDDDTKTEVKVKLVGSEIENQRLLEEKKGIEMKKIRLEKETSELEVERRSLRQHRKNLIYENELLELKQMKMKNVLRDMYELKREEERKAKEMFADDDPNIDHQKITLIRKFKEFEEEKLKWREERRKEWKFLEKEKEKLRVEKHVIRRSRGEISHNIKRLEVMKKGCEYILKKRKKRRSSKSPEKITESRVVVVEEKTISPIKRVKPIIGNIEVAVVEEEKPHAMETKEVVVEKVPEKLDVAEVEEEEEGEVVEEKNDEPVDREKVGIQMQQIIESLKFPKPIPSQILEQCRISMQQTHTVPQNEMQMFEFIFKNTTMLDLSSSAVTEKSQMLLSLVKLLKSPNIGLKELKLSNSQVVDNSLKIILDAMVSNNDLRLENLDLSKNQVTKLGIGYLAEFLGKNSSLVTVDFCDNKVEAVGFSSIVEKICANANSKVENLYFRNCGIVAKDLGDWNIRTTNNSLRVLYVIGNNFSEGGMSFFTGMIKCCVKLERVILALNSISDDVLLEIFKAIWNHSSLKSLDLRGNRISLQNVELETVFKLVVENSSLEDVDLSGNQIKTNDAEKLSLLGDNIKVNIGKLL